MLLVSTEAGAGQGRAWLDVAPGGEKVVASSSNCDNSALVKLILTILMVSWLP